jgi:hypothetical protein
VEREGLWNEWIGRRARVVNGRHDWVVRHVLSRLPCSNRNQVTCEPDSADQVDNA